MHTLSDIVLTYTACSRTTRLQLTLSKQPGASWSYDILGFPLVGSSNYQVVLSSSGWVHSELTLYRAKRTWHGRKVSLFGRTSVLCASSRLRMLRVPRKLLLEFCWPFGTKNPGRCGSDLWASYWKFSSRKMNRLRELTEKGKIGRIQARKCLSNSSGHWDAKTMQRRWSNEKAKVHRESLRYGMSEERWCSIEREIFYKVALPQMHLPFPAKDANRGWDLLGAFVQLRAFTARVNLPPGFALRVSTSGKMLVHGVQEFRGMLPVCLFKYHRHSRSGLWMLKQRLWMLKHAASNTRSVFWENNPAELWSVKYYFRSAVRSGELAQNKKLGFVQAGEKFWFCAKLPIKPYAHSVPCLAI